MANVVAIVRRTNVSLSQPRFTITIRPAATINNGNGGVSSYNDLDDVPLEFPPEAHVHAIADVTGLQGALDGKAPSAHGHVIADVTGLQGALDGKQASLGFTAENTTNKGAAGGYASLDGTGKVPAGQLPSYVDDVVEADNFAALPVTGDAGKIYITLNDNAQYRWSGSAYVQLTASPGTTDAVPEGTGNLYFTEARVRNTPLTGYAVGARTALAAADTVLGAFGKIGKWLSDLASIAFSGSASDLTAGTLPAARFDDTAHGSRAGGSLHPAASTSVAGFMSGADKTKLDSVASGATANSPDATLLARANHTGSQLAATISDFAAAVAALITGKQNNLVSGTNIKTINGNSILGSGNLVVSGGTSVLSTEIDVGVLPVKEASINVIDATVTPTTKISAYQSGRAATGRPADENQWTRLHVVARPNTGSFDLWVLCLNGTMSGKFNIDYLKG